MAWVLSHGGRSEDKETWRFSHFASKISDQRPETLSRLLTSMPDTQPGRPACLGRRRTRVLFSCRGASP